MARYHVRCIGTTEEEVGAAVATLGRRAPVTRSGFYVSGQAEDEDVASLRDVGLIVEVLPVAASLGWLEPGGAPSGPAALADEAPAPTSSLARFAQGVSEYHIVQFTGPLAADDRRQLSTLGVRLGSSAPNFASKVQLNQEQRQAIQELPFVTRVVHYSPSMTVASLRERGRQGAPPAPRLPIDARFGIATPHSVAPEAEPPRLAMAEPPGPVIYDVACHDPADLPGLQDALQAEPRPDRAEAGRHRVRVWTTAGPRAERLKAGLAALPQVSVIERFRYPEPQCETVRVAVGLDASSPSAGLPWDGSGQIIAVADSGIDTQHPDLKTRIAKVVERVPAEAPDDPFGHGTHVSGIICGDGTASGGRIRGMAPGATLFVQSIRDADGHYSGLPVDLGVLFQEAFEAGARIHNNSWGTAVQGLYTIDAFEVDHFVYEHPEFLVVVAAGNEGQQPAPSGPATAVAHVGFNSLTSPGAAKNALTVGACCSARVDGPYRGRAWKEYQGKLPSPQHPPVSEEPINGDLSVLAAFSSRGPSDDERVKPDLVAPGTVVLAARSATSATQFSSPDFDKHYAFKSGTSMAAPVVAGAAGIARQYYVSERAHLGPSAALLKATLINGCAWIDRDTVNDGEVGRPNFHQGFGRLDLATALPRPGNPDGAALAFIDIGRTDAGALSSTELARSVWRRRVQVGDALPLRVTLVWTDYPAHGLQHQLDLVLVGPDNQKIVGNPELRRGSWAKMDRANNVERIVVAAPPRGIWTVLVMASNTPFGDQGFSLVATGQLLGDFS